MEDLVGRVDLWSAESDDPESFLAAGLSLGSGVLYTQVEAMTADEAELIAEQLLRDGADWVTRSAIREAWAMVDEADEVRAMPFPVADPLRGRRARLGGNHVRCPG